MKKAAFSVFIGALLVFGSFLPSIASAQAVDQGYQGDKDPTKSGFQLVSCTGVVDPRTEKGTECNYNQLIFTFSRVLRFVLYILSLIVLGMILYMGYQFLTAGGDTKKLGDAKKMATPIALGIFFIFAAYVIVYQVILGYLIRADFGKDGVGNVTKSDIIGGGNN